MTQSRLHGLVEIFVLVYGLKTAKSAFFGQVIEFEDGVGNNESVTYATRVAIEAAVLELIYQGHDRGFWVLEEGHRHPHNSDGTNDLHKWYENANEVIGGDELKPLEEKEENE